LIERRPGKGVFVREARAARRMIQFVIGTNAWDPWMLTQGRIQAVSNSSGVGAWDPWITVARGAQEFGQAHGVQIQICHSQGDVDLDLAMLQSLPGSGVSGALIVSVHRPHFNDALYALKQAELPFVLLDQQGY